MYSIASRSNICLLFNAHKVHKGHIATRYSLRKELVTYLLFLTTDIVPADVDFSGDEARQDMTRHYKVFTNTPWIQLRFGTLVDVYGCGDVVCFLLLPKDQKSMRQVKLHSDVMERIASFL
ncbi:hypothetical protein LSM04_000718 [Trypanosoma melophagium]|uniref:uncharacterized protein n=1 Tax=Trypanosoma melophagium TaxID=715481 RepID=UPI00351A67E4|nr:hypothetical protein LSM04_000718 [Trypanosoma melophagium]